jgi:hypothetical protein
MDQDDKVYGQRRETFLAVILITLLGGGLLLFLVVITGGFFLYVVLAVVAIGVVGYVHYLLWGHAMTQEVAGEREEEEAREHWENENAGSQETSTPQQF